MRNTKIIATLGPATDPIEMLQKMIVAGMDVARLNMSHGTKELQVDRIKKVQDLAKKLNKKVEILVDLQGPKIRIGKFINQKILLHKNDKLILDPNLDANYGTQQSVNISYYNLFKDVKPKDILLLDDGKIELLVEKIDQNKIICAAINDVMLSDNKGINIKGGGLSANSLTDKDEEDLLFVLNYNVNSVALSFVKTPDDIAKAKKIISSALLETKIDIIAKIETKEAINNLEQIMQVSDGVMVARGDLGVELGLSQLPMLQKNIVKTAKKFNKPAIVATQMMESMVENYMPTRAEVMDVANAVLDGASGVEFSEETAIGNYPDLVIKYADEICQAAEKL